MAEIKERRYSHRHHFSGSNVFCREKVILGLFNQYSEPLPLNDLNKSGLGFQADREYAYGDRLHLKLEINGSHRIHLVGEVRWVAPNKANSGKNVGIQFLPFGTVKGYNSFSTREKLDRLISPLEKMVSQDNIILN